MEIMIFKQLSACFILWAFLCNTAVAAAYFEFKNSIGMGAAYQSINADLRSSVGALPEVSVDLDDLGMDREDWSWALEGRWRFKPKWMLVGLAYQFEHDGARAISRDFNFEGKEFQAGTFLNTEISINTYIVDLMYQVYDSERAEVLVGGGVHAIDFDVSMSGAAFIGDQERQSARGSSELLAPLPNFRVQGFYAINQNWGAAVALGWLSADYDGYDGSFSYLHPRIAYAFAEHWSITAGYQYVKIDVTHQESNNRESAFDMNFNGPTIFMSYRF